MQLNTLFRSRANEESLVNARKVSYENWREACDRVAEAYRSWAAAPRDQRWLAHAAYLAALEREERAASTYQRLVEHLRATVRGGVT